MSMLIKHLDSNGDGTGAINFISDYSSVQGIAKIAPPANKIYRIARFLIEIEDTGGMQAQEYGNLGGPLTNGVATGVSKSEKELLRITENHAIKTNAQWAMLCYDVDVKSWGAGNDLLAARFTFKKFGEPLTLNGRSGDYLWVTFDDNLVGLITHHFVAQGIIEDA